MNNKRLKKILIEEGWFEKFYYVRKVLDSCRNVDWNKRFRCSSVNKTYWWGEDVLKREMKSIAKKHFMIDRNDMYEYLRPYYDDLLLLRERVYDYLLTKNR